MEQQQAKKKGGRPKGSTQRPAAIRLGQLTDRALLRALHEAQKDGGVPSAALLAQCIKRLGQCDEPLRHKIAVGTSDERERLESARARNAERATPRGAA